MTFFRSRSALAAAGAGLGLALLADPAFAGSHVADDADDDVERYVDGSYLGRGDFDVDVRTATFEHRVDRFVLTAAFSDLRVDSWNIAYIDFDLDGDRVIDYVAEFPGSGEAGLYQGTDPESGVLVCADLAVEQDLATDTLRLTVRRACLGDPPTFRVQFDIGRTSYDPVLDSSELVIEGVPEYVGAVATFTPEIAVDRAVVVPAPQAPQPIGSAVSASASGRVQKLGKKPVKLTIRSGAGAAGTVTVRDGARTLATRRIAAGQALAYRLPTRLKVGKHTITVSFAPADGSRFLASSATVRVRVKR